ncbi:hypothetical protein GCM10011428_02730 [Streptomyces violaceus]
MSPGPGTVIDHCAAQTFERHLNGYDQVPDSLGGERLEKHLWVLKPGRKAIGIAESLPSALAREAGLNR